MLRDHPIDRREDGPLYRFTSNQLYSSGFAGVGLGIARGLIDAFLDLPATKISRGAAKPMRENNVVQSQLAQAKRNGTRPAPSCTTRWTKSTTTSSSTAR